MHDVADLAAHLGATETVTIVTTRPNGDEIATPIWAVTVDGAPYVRAAFGPRTSWYLRAVSGRPLAFTTTDGRRAEEDPVAALGDPRVDVVVERVDDEPTLEAVDAAFLDKYAHSPYGATMVTPENRVLTLRVAPTS